MSYFVSQIAYIDVSSQKITLAQFKDIFLTIFDFCQNQGDVTGLISGVHFDQKVDFLPKWST